MGSGSSRRRGPVATGGGGGGDPRGPGAAPGPAEAAAGGEGAAALPAPGSPPREAVLPASPPDPENNNVSNEQGCRLCLQVCSSCWPELHADAFWRWFSTRQMFTWMKSKQLRPQKRWLKCVCWCVILARGHWLPAFLPYVLLQQKPDSSQSFRRRERKKRKEQNWLNPTRELPGEAAAEGRVQCP
ncbi:cystin-1 isoform X1 [Cygnus atratus]|uniref:cystin-1 isoform X1 n=1 Tax=Cygnus atratus TaxID=8868 RepID=UPI0021B788A4|nr:cystin-1 isoform X1 [Cygnus atratus]